ncbi:MAG: ATP-binding protein [Defluviicoccus sp.]|nr:ATP-binding protein [Defluviicoccus sp.]
MKRPLEMKISLHVLEHLGMNLYSTIPAVLSEIVANSWDADATDVAVSLDKENDVITIHDNGIGMTRDEVADRFLEVGFRRRIEIGSKTPLRNRDPMGRKGIGKLSSFSIARVVTVYTIKDGEQTAFVMDAKKIKERIEANDGVAYRPDELDHWPDHLSSGTLIKLTGLRRRISQLTQKGLRQRLARRFSVIGPKFAFSVTVDGTPVEPRDRGYYEHIEYLWTYGNQSDLMQLFKNLSQGRAPVDRTSNVHAPSHEAGIEITGWIGTVKRPEFLKDEENENLNRLAVFMRGKQAHEDILDGFGEKEIYADYVVGELHCDDLDRDNDEDIATSSRQTLKADDPRFQALREIIYRELRNVAARWSDWRRGDGARVLAQSVPEVSAWLEELTGDTKKKAERWVGRLNTMRTGKETEKRELLKASILAFESYRRKEQLDYLDQLTDESIEPVLSVFNDIDDLQLSYYGQIVKLRLGVITTLEQKLNADDKETVIRDHIFDHLWLLDAGWERVKGSEASERNITGFLKTASKKLTSTEKRGRIDIGYRTVSGRHVIIELKRGSVATPVDDLTRQIRKYRSGAKKLIEKTIYPDWPLDIICLVGKPPPEWDDDAESVRDQLAALDARLLFYDQLLGSSRRAYADYLEEHKKVDRLWKIFQGIDDFVANG